MFVDLLPDSWTGPPPGLPQEVIRELAERARIAERELRQQRAISEAKKRPPIRVRASVQPTFVRFVFEMPDGVGVSSVLNEQKLRLQFSAVLVFDLADAKLAAPSNIASINQKVEGDASVVEITMIGDVDVHSFREEKNYVIDVAFQQAEKASVLPSVSDASHPPDSAAPTPAAPAVTAPATSDKAASEKAVSEKAVSERAASEKAPAMAAASPQPGEIVPPTSEMLAQQAKIEINPSQAPQTPPATEGQMPARPSKEPPAPSMAAAAEAPPKKPLAAPAPPAEVKSGGSPAASVSAARDSDGLRLTFAFPAATPAALFRRADTVWLLFDSKKPIDIEPIRGQGGSVIGDISVMPLEKGQAVRFRLTRPQLPSLTGEDQPGGTSWTVTFADAMLTPTQPLAVIRNIADPTLANVSVPLPKAGLLHRLVDPDAGDTLLVVTAMPPVRGFIKRQDFVELSLLESIHGVAIRPNSDDVTVEIASDKVILGKPGGLTLSPADTGVERASTAVRPIFDLGEWRKNQEGSFVAREDALIEAAAMAAPDQRTPARIDLARFYLSRGLYCGSQGYPRSRHRRHQAGCRRSGRPDRARGREHPDGAPGAGAEGPRQSGDRHQLRFAALEGDGQCAAGKVGGSAREIQERRIRHHLAADRTAAHRDRRRDAFIARGQGLPGCRETRRRARSHRPAARIEARDCGAARQARRRAWARQGCAG